MEEQANEISNNSISRRTNTRLAAVKALYTSQINEKIDITKSPAQLTVDIIEFYFETEGKQKSLDKDFLAELIRGVYENKETLDNAIKDKLSKEWRLERISPVLISIMRAAVFELMNFTDTPLKVIINEYVNITRAFFDENEVGFVNGILDKIGHEVRN